LAEERTLKAKSKFNNTKPLANNIIAIYIDALGRNDVLRRLPKTSTFFA
jgi:hypothetical protein